MTSQQKTDTLSEFARRINELWEEAERAGIIWEFQACCCGEGLVITDEETGRQETIY